jgi:signal transduction histidine kinase
MTSLARRLSMTLILSFAGLMVVVTLIFLLLSRHYWEAADIQSSTEPLFKELAQSVRLDGQGRAILKPSPEFLLLARQFPQLTYAVWDPQQKIVLAGSHPALGRDLSYIRAHQLQEANLLRQSQDKLVHSYFKNLPTAAQRPMLLALAYHSTPTRDGLTWAYHELTNEILPLIVPLFLIMLVIGQQTIRRGLQPVERISQQVAELPPLVHAHQLLLDDVPDEIVPLVAAFNQALASIHDVFQQQRRFTADAAHQLRTPLAVLQARIDTLEPSYTTQLLTADVARMARIIQQLLKLARVQNDLTPIREQVDLAALAWQVGAMMMPLASQRGLQIAINTPEQPVWIWGDPHQWEDVLTNLIENALQNTAMASKVEVIVKTGVELQVRDHGQGIATHLLPHLFEPFRRGQGGKGAGLGLAIVAEIVAAHGGSIKAQNCPDGGACLSIRLPPALEPPRRDQQAVNPDLVSGTIRQASNS